MLVAAHGLGGPSRVRQLIERVSLASGAPLARLQNANGAAAGWDGPNRVQVNGEHEWIAEGSLEFETGEITQATLERAVGDFALLALRDDGVLLASGRAGGYRPIYVASPSPDLVVASTRLTAVLTLLPGRAPIDLGYLSASILGTMPHPESTPYTSVRRLPPGEAWLIRPGVRPERWNTRRPLVDIQLKDDRELGERGRHGLEAQEARGATRRLS